MSIDQFSRKLGREVADLRRRAERAAPIHDGPESSKGASLLLDALATCDNLLEALAAAHLQCDVLSARITQERSNWDHLFEAVPIPCITTDRGSVIFSANQAAADLLSVTRVKLPDRLLLHFVTERERFTALLAIPPLEQERRSIITVRPRDRRPVEMEVRVTPFTTDASVLLWFLCAPG